MININENIRIPDDEIVFSATRSEGPGGQHVNKTSSAIELRFDINASTLPDDIKEKLLKLKHHSLTSGGVIIIRVQEHRSLHRNREIAIERFRQLILSALVVRKKRIATKPSKSAVEKRLESKRTRSITKKMRGRIDSD